MKRVLEFFRFLRVSYLRKLFAKSIKAKLVLIFSLIYAVLIFLLVYFFNSHLQAQVSRQMELHSLAFAQNIKAANIGNLQRYQYQAIEQNLAEIGDSPEIAWILIFDKENDLVAKSGLLADHFSYPRSTLIKEMPLLTSPKLEHMKIEDSETSVDYEVLNVVVPVFMGGSKVKWGTVLLGMNLEPLTKRIGTTRFFVFFAGLALIFIGILAVSFLANKMVRPIERMIETASSIAKGDLSQRIRADSEDELGILARNFNVMSEQLQLQVGDLLSINELSRELSSVLKQEQAVDYLYKFGKKLFKLDGFLLGVLSRAGRDKMELTFKSERRTSSKSLTKDYWPDLIHNLVFQKRTTFYSGVPEYSEIAVSIRSVTGEDFSSLLAVPMVYGGRSLGFVMILNQKEMLYQPSEIHYLTIIANQAAVSIINARSYKIISELNVDLEKKVKERTEELEKQNLQLEDTNRKLSEAHAQLLQSSKMVALGQLVAGVAHEINSPLGSINSNTDVFNRLFHKIEQILKESKSKKIKDKLSTYIAELKPLNLVSQEACDRIIKIVGGLKNFARLDEARRKPASVNKGLKSTISLIAHEAKGRIRIHTGFGDVPSIMCYPDQLNQVFMNILVNAVQAIQDEGDITVQTFLEDDKLIVTIRDTGVGIPEKNLDKIFDPGFTTKGVGIGTGLGLSISYRIIEKHKGTIKVSSTPGEGSCFKISLPLE